MPPLPAFMAAHQDFAWDGPPGADAPHLLSTPRYVHAVLAEAPGPAEPWFQDYARTGHSWRALCGAEVLVVTPDFYDELTPGSCKRCAAAVEQWLDDERLIRWERVVTRPGAMTARR